MFRIATAIAATLLVLPPQPLHAQDQGDYAALAAQDRRMAQVAERIMAANAPLCRERMPITGLLIHTADQYPAPEAAWFANGDAGIAQVLPGSAAQDAGLQANDAIVAINGIAIATLEWEQDRPHRDTVFSLLAIQADDQPLTITIRRDGTLLDVAMRPRPGCRLLAEVLADNDETARSDGRVIQISYGLATRLGDDELAVAFSHELAHAILEHRRRLSEAGVDKGGIGGQFGRNRRLSRQAEEEADRLSVHLLANAGYDPGIAPRFWENGAGVDLDGGLFRSRIYQSRRNRAQTLRTEISAYLANGPATDSADRLVALRDQPIDND